MNSGSNALLESPTGTGKTLCLLCSALAWQSHSKRQFSSKVTLAVNNGPLVPQAPKIPASLSTSTIIYASRTHSQLAQVVSELRTTTYRPNMTVLGSREQLCVHDRIKKKRGGALNFACNKENSTRSCPYKNNVDKYVGPSSTNGATTTMLDIEDLVALGTTDRVCPYFYTREFSQKADLLLMPYNYLLDSSIRATINLNWSNSIIIFDEAHNLERIAADAASFKLTSTDIANCISELQQVLRLLQVERPQSRSSEGPGAADGIKKLSSDTGSPTMASAARILRGMFELEKKLDEIPLSKGIGNTPSLELSAENVIRMVESCGLSFALVNIFQSCLLKLLNIFILETDHLRRPKEMLEYVADRRQRQQSWCRGHG
jgi:Rad3-related DNA helicase